MPLPSVRTVGRAVDVWVAVLRSWRFSEGDQPRCTPGRPSAWRPASSSPCTAFATCPAAMLRVIAAVARSTRGLRGGGRGATDLIAASAYWISARDHFALIFPLLPVADARAGFKVGGCLSLIEHSDRALWALSSRLEAPPGSCHRLAARGRWKFHCLPTVSCSLPSWRLLGFTEFLYLDV